MAHTEREGGRAVGASGAAPVARGRREPAPAGKTELGARPAPARPEPTAEDIARRAYEIYLERGGEHGYDQEDWLRAERELREGRP